MQATKITRPVGWIGSGRDEIQNVGVVPSPRNQAGLDRPAGEWTRGRWLRGFLLGLLIAVLVALVYIGVVAGVHWAVRGRGHGLPRFAVLSLLGAVGLALCINLGLAFRHRNVAGRPR